MASLDQGIYEEMLEQADIVGLVSSRIYPADDVPQDVTVPYIAYDIQAQSQSAHDGPVSLGDHLVTFSVFGEDKNTVVTISEKLRIVWLGFSGTLGNTSITASVYGWRRQTSDYERESRLFHIPCDLELFASQDT